MSDFNSNIIWTANSKFNKSIKLNRRTWEDKLLKQHPEFDLNPAYPDELRKTIEDPEFIVEGWKGEYLALRWCELAPKSAKYLCAVYREFEKEGFLITAFFISRYGRLLRRKILWRKSVLW